ncbi:MAG TPA: tetratricopeptide repeat protein [Planctomycetes bacterium]|nr:tetratricopeptide repeat protein [Planctomycetota bacterium]
MPQSPLIRLLLLTCLVWSGGLLRGGFALDDLEVLRGNPVVQGDVPWQVAFQQDYWAHQPAGSAGHFRPLATLSLRWDHRLWGLEPWGYHVTNLLLHLCVVALAGSILAGLERGGGAAAWLGLGVFALHPALCDSVVWISGRTSMLSALPGLLGAYWLLRPGSSWRTACLAGLALAGSMLGKEDGVLFALILPLVAARTGGRRGAGAAGLGVLVALACCAWLRYLALGQWMPAATHAPLAGVPLLERLHLGGGVLWRLLTTFLTPFSQAAPQAGVEAIAATPGWLTRVMLVALAGVVIAGLRALLRGRDPALGASLLLSSLALLVHAQLIPSGELFGPRFLYLPLLLGVLPLDRSLRGIHARCAPHAPWPWILALAAVPLVWFQAETYGSRRLYWEAVLEDQPGSPQAWNALGNAAMEDGQAWKARRAWERATELAPDYSRPWTNLGGQALKEGQLVEALEYLQRATQVGADNPVAWANLGNALLRQGDPAAAIVAYDRATTLAPSVAALWRGMARAQEAGGHREAAQVAIEKALALNPQDVLVRDLAQRLKGK